MRFVRGKHFMFCDVRGHALALKVKTRKKLPMNVVQGFRIPYKIK